MFEFLTGPYLTRPYLTGPYILALFVIFVLLTWYLMKKTFGASHRFYDPYTTFPYLSNLADPRNFEVIIKELKDADWYQWPEKELWNKPGDDWTVCPLFGFGHWNVESAKKFPQTVQLLKEIPGLRTAIFSRLGPKTKLQPHQGWASLANEVLRCHLGVIVPSDGRSGVEVEEEFRQIRERDWITFDDSKLHIGVNEGSTERIVLLIDINRPWWVRWGKSTVNETAELTNFLDTVTR